MPQLLVRYAWLWVMLGVLINIGFSRVRLHAAARRGEVTRADADRFVRVALAGLGGPILAQAAIAAASGQPNAFCPLLLAPGASPFSAAAWGVQVLWPVILLGWLWRGDGAEMIARVWPILRSRSRPPLRVTARGVRLAVTAALVIGAAGFFLFAPHPADPAAIADLCPVTTTASHGP